MAAYEFQALDGRGRTRKGIIEGDGASHVRQLIRERGMTPLQVLPSRKVESSGKLGRSLFTRIGSLELSMCTHQLSTLINAGVPIAEALQVIASQSEKKRVQRVLMSVRSKVLEGHSLATALGEFPSTFSALYRSTVKAGEQSGYLDTVLDNLANFLEESFQARRDLESAIYYPLLLLVSALGIVAFLMIYILPDIVELFDKMGAELPLVTTLLISTSEVFREWGLLIAVVLLVVFAGFRMLLAQPNIRERWDRQKMSLPLIGWLSRGSNSARYASTLSILGESGVPLVDGMSIASEVVSNQWFRRKLGTATEQVREGSSLRVALEGIEIFPPMFLHMIGSGEASAQLSTMLGKVAGYQQKELKRAIDTMVNLLPPMMLFLMAGLVLFIMLAVLLPILNMNALVL